MLAMVTIGTEMEPVSFTLKRLTLASLCVSGNFHSCTAMSFNGTDEIVSTLARKSDVVVSSVVSGVRRTALAAIVICLGYLPHVVLVGWVREPCNKPLVQSAMSDLKLVRKGASQR